MTNQLSGIMLFSNAEQETKEIYAGLFANSGQFIIEL